jgi:sugar transferase EpsL
MAKRIFDIICAVIAIIVCAPLALAIAILVAIFLGRPVLFRQKRPGLLAKPFELFKFRTMTDARNESGELLSDRQRLTRFGSWLRSTSLDEIPQLINVIRGDISLVGPRPLLVKYLPLYTKTEMRRHEVRPGLTGWAQIHGRNHLDWNERLAMDVWYVDNRSFGLDLKIILKTVRIVLARSGTTEAGEATMTGLDVSRRGDA